MIDLRGIKQRWAADGSKRDERGRRIFAASEVRAAGRGALAAVSEITGLARSTIGRGLKDLDAPPPLDRRIRRKGGGPKPLTERDPTLLAALKRLVEPATLGDPMRPLLWVSKSHDKLAAALAATASFTMPIASNSSAIHYEKRANQKSPLDQKDHPKHPPKTDPKIGTTLDGFTSETWTTSNRKKWTASSESAR